MATIHLKVLEAELTEPDLYFWQLAVIISCIGTRMYRLAFDLITNSAFGTGIKEPNIRERNLKE